MTDVELIKHRLQKLRSLLGTHEFDALIVNRGDEHLSDYLPPNKERLAYITGFTGSAGTAVILKAQSIKDISSSPISIEKEDLTVLLRNTAALFVDGRYTLQARVQANSEFFDSFQYNIVSMIEWLKAILPANSVVGIDPMCVSYNSFNELKNELALNNITLKFTPNNFIDGIWQEKANEEFAPVVIFEDKYNGCPSVEKRKQIAKILRDKQLDALFISSSESVNWLLNVRGRDVPNLPVINSFLVIYSSEQIEWYVDQRKIPNDMLSELQHHFGKIDYYPEDKLLDLAKRLGKNHTQLYVDPRTTNAWIIHNLKAQGVEVTFGNDLCELPRGCKNPTEVEGMKKCHLRDAVAMCRFLAWLDHLTEPLINADPNDEKHSPAYELALTHNEETISNQLFHFRSEQEGFIETSFDTISALGPNASLIHYNHVNLGNPRSLGLDSIYLVDSGGQYCDGTTDITRTVLVGPNPSKEIKERFTLVLKGLIAMHRIRFPKNTYGITLDVLARAPLWQYGLNYEHGTGHGVGHCLNVHEGPQSISQRGGQCPLQEGMVTSVEPGYYKDNEYGIRLENLTVVEKVKNNLNQSNMYAFTPITFVPFDTRLIAKELLTENEKNWLNEYHFKVRDIVKEHLSDFEISWLLKATAAI